MILLDRSNAPLLPLAPSSEQVPIPLPPPPREVPRARNRGRAAEGVHRVGAKHPFPCLPRRSRRTALPLGSLPEGEKALSWQSHGVALTAFELGNGTLCVPFPDRARALPRETVPRRGGRSSPYFKRPLEGAVLPFDASVDGKTEGVNLLTLSALSRGEQMLS